LISEKTKLGESLEEKYLRQVRLIERRLCNCFKGKSSKYIQSTYPKCLSVDGLTAKEADQVVDAYWDFILPHFKEKYPEKLMEIYLLQEYQIQD